MDKFCIDILNKLLDKYENSVLSKQGSERKLSISLNLKSKELSTYTSYDSYKYRDNNDLLLQELEQDDFIKVNRDSDGALKSLQLVLKNVDNIYKYLNRINPKIETKKIEKILVEHDNIGIIHEFVLYNLQFIKHHFVWCKNYFDSAYQLELIIKALENIINLQEEIKERDFSIETYGDSKLFATIKNKVAKILKDFSNDCTQVETDDILADFNIVKNSTYAILKQNLRFKINEQEIDLNLLNTEYCLSDEMIKTMEILSCSANKLITVENLTSFYLLNDKNAIIVYLGGFHNHTKQILLKKIYAKYPNIEYYHFGDIDAGGFYIYNNLIANTGINFKPYKMGIDDLKQYKTYGKTLTKNDILRLNQLLTNDQFKVFHEVIMYMLDNNVKLEQEIFDI